jgi:exosome complex component RRP43
MTKITGTPSSLPTLSFPRETFAKLSPRPYLLAHLQPSDSSPSLRANGRSPAQFRAPHINNGSLTYAEGSAVVRLGDTTAVCGIRGEILLATDVPNYRVDRSSSSGGTYNEAKELDLLVPNIELATGCSPAFLPGQPPSTLAQSLSTRIYSLLHSSGLVDTEDLRIWHQAPVISATEQKGSDGEEESEIAEREVKAFWTLYIDILFISLDGNPFDIAWAAVLSALRDVRLPFAYWDIDRQMILCSDEFSQSKKLNLHGIPIACTYGIFRAKERNIQVHPGEIDDAKYWVLADLDTFEESLCEETVTVVVDCSQPGGTTRVLGISKSGGSVVGRREMRELIERASKRWEEWRGVLTNAKAS